MLADAIGPGRKARGGLAARPALAAARTVVEDKRLPDRLGQPVIDLTELGIAIRTARQSLDWNTLQVGLVELPVKRDQLITKH